MQRSLIHTLAMFMDEICCKAPSPNFNFTNSFFTFTWGQSAKFKDCTEVGRWKGSSWNWIGLAIIIYFLYSLPLKHIRNYVENIQNLPPNDVCFFWICSQAESVVCRTWCGSSSKELLATLEGSWEEDDWTSLSCDIMWFVTTLMHTWTILCNLVSLCEHNFVRLST